MSKVCRYQVKCPAGHIVKGPVKTGELVGAGSIYGKPTLPAISTPVPGDR